MRRINRHSVVACVAGAACGLVGASVATAQTCYRLTDIRALGFPPGTDDMFGINNLGEVAFTAVVNGEKHAFVWLPNPNYGLVGGLHDLNLLPEPDLSGPSAAHDINMADVHDNDGLGQKFCEAIYVQDLIIEAGATLNTLGCPVYYVNLTNNGTVDNPANLIAMPPPCPEDLNGDGFVNSADLTILLGAWAAGTSGGDIDGDGDTDSADLTLLLGAWAAGGCS